MKFTATTKGALPDKESVWQEYEFIDDFLMMMEDFDVYCSGNGISLKANADPDEVRKVYGLEPSYIINKDTCVFLYDDISEHELDRIQNTLKFLYCTDEIILYYQTKENINEYKKIDKLELEKLDVMITSHIRGKMEIHLKNDYENVEKILVEDIMLKAEYDDYEYDQYNEFIIDKGRGSISKKFDFVHKHLGDKQKAFDFFRENFGIPFPETREEAVNDVILIEDSSNKGIEIRTGHKLNNGYPSFETNQRGYYIKSKDDSMQITDFIITLYYRIVHEGGEVEYLVKLINPQSGDETPEIVWSKDMGLTKFQSEICGYGNFHFFGKASIIGYLHQAIASQNVKPITTLNGIGFFGDKVVFSNGVYNMKTKRLTCTKGSRFVFDDEGRGYMSLHRNGKLFKEQVKSKLPEFYTNALNIDSKDIWDFFGSIYATDKGSMLLMYVWGMLGYGLFGDIENDKYLGLFAYGIKGSGKTEFNKIIARVFNMNLNPYGFNEVTLFVMTSLIAHFNKVPVIFNEFRESVGRGVKGFAAKMDKLRTTFDKGEDARGTANQEMISYPCMAHAVIDGEERIKDAANKSRMVQIQMSKKDQVEGMAGKFSTVIEDSQEIQGLVYSYLQNVDFKNGKEKYSGFVREGIKIFGSIKDVEPRLKEGYALIYAGVMMIFPEKSDEYKNILSKYCELQNKELQAGAGHREFFKVLGRTLHRISGCYSVVYNKNNGGNEVIFSLEMIQEYFESRKIQLTVDISEYFDYIQNAGYKIEMRELDEFNGYHECFVIPIDEKFPLELCKGQIAQAYNTIIKKRKNV